MENADVSPTVEATGLTFAYPSGHTLFSQIAVTAQRGTMLCITGRSGAGKSTLLYCLAGVLHADGDIRLMGEPLGTTPSERAKMRLHRVGFIFQRGELLPELTVVENVALPLRLTGKSRRVAHDTAISALAQLGIDDCAQRQPSEISGGQAQRASVARALIHGPPIVFADEPTASLDASSRDDVLATLQHTVRAGTTIVCATHDPALIDIADNYLELGQQTRGLHIAS